MGIVTAVTGRSGALLQRLCRVFSRPPLWTLVSLPSRTCSCFLVFSSTVVVRVGRADELRRQRWPGWRLGRNAFTEAFYSLN